MKINNFVKYFKERGLEIFQNFREIFKYFKVKCFIVHPYVLSVTFCPDSGGRRNEKRRTTEMRPHGMTRLKQ